METTTGQYRYVTSELENALHHLKEARSFIKGVRDRSGLGDALADLDAFLERGDIGGLTGMINELEMALDRDKR